MKRNLVIGITIIAVIALVLSLFLFLQPKKPQEPLTLYDTLNLQQMQINSFDPIDAYHAGHIQIVKQIYNTLTDIDFEGNTVPSLAEKWDSEDGITWTFNLKRNVFFSQDPSFSNLENRLLTAKDVKYSFERMLHKDSQSLGISYFGNLLGIEDYRNGTTNEIEGIKIKDDYTIFFVLKKKDLDFYKLLSLPYTSVVKKDAVEYYKDNFKMHPVGTGPFTLQNYEANKEITLIKNEDYWENWNGKQLPFVDKVVIYLTTDDNLALLMFKNQKTDFLELTLPLANQLKTMNLSFPYKVESKENAQLNFYLFNLEKIPDNNTRKAISFAINRDELQRILADEGQIAHSMYPPSIFKNISTSQSTLTYNPTKAKEILPGKIKSLKLVSFEDILSKSVAEFIARSLKEYQIDVKIESVPFPVLVDRLMKGEYDLIQIYWGPLYADVVHYSTPFLSSSFPPAGNNFNRYQNPEFDRLINESKTLSGTKQNENYLQAENIILDDMPFLLLYFKNTIRVSNEKFDFPLHPLQYRLYKYANKK